MTRRKQRAARLIGGPCVTVHDMPWEEQVRTAGLAGTAILPQTRREFTAQLISANKTKAVGAEASANQRPTQSSLAQATRTFAA